MTFTFTASNLQHVGRLDTAETRVLATSQDVEDAVDVVAECVQLTPGRFSGWSSAETVGVIDIRKLALERGVRLRVDASPDEIVVGFLLSEQRAIERAAPWTPHKAVVASDSSIDVSTQRDASFMFLRIRRDALAPAYQESLEPLGGTFLVDVSFFAAVRRLALQYAKDAGELERGFILALRRAAPFARADGTSEHRSVALVRSVEKFMWENVEEPLTLERICKDMHCGVRALIYAFKDVYGIGPMTYWKARRLDGAHRRLRASQGKMPILEIAADFGFWHMGHFSADHKAMFGMTPSQAIELGRAR